jgi:hypothetical protein
MKSETRAASGWVRFGSASVPSVEELLHQAHALPAAVSLREVDSTNLSKSGES